MQQSKPYFHLPLFSAGFRNLSKIKDSIEKIPDPEEKRKMHIHLNARETFGGVASQIYAELNETLMPPKRFEDFKSTFAGNMRLLFRNYRILAEGLGKAGEYESAAECFVEAGRALAVIKDFFECRDQVYEAVFKSYEKASLLFWGSGKQLESVETRLELIQLYLKFFAVPASSPLAEPLRFDEGVPHDAQFKFNRPGLMKIWIDDTLREMGHLDAEDLRALKEPLCASILPMMTHDAESSGIVFIRETIDYFCRALNHNYLK